MGGWANRPVPQYSAAQQAGAAGKEAVAVLTFIRTSSGNDAPRLTPNSRLYGDGNDQQDDDSPQNCLNVHGPSTLFDYSCVFL
ncbi:MAG: hypothetical protein L0H73_15430 [Nitrococcus sp.]|nr:hypothetical protein [Nitrococcus sp.]